MTGLIVILGFVVFVLLLHIRSLRKEIRCYQNTIIEIEKHRR
jgi:hypothetical protein